MPVRLQAAPCSDKSQCKWIVHGGRQGREARERRKARQGSKRTSKGKAGMARGRRKKEKREYRYAQYRAERTMPLWPNEQRVPAPGVRTRERRFYVVGGKKGTSSYDVTCVHCHVVRRSLSTTAAAVVLMSRRTTKLKHHVRP